MLPSNTDDVDCVGPHGPSRRSDRSHCMFSSIGRPVQNSAAYPQLAKQTSALCASGVQTEMRPSVCGCRRPGAERYPRSYPSMAPCGGAAGQLRASAHEAVKGLIPRKMETPRLTDAGAGRRFRWSLDIVERCIDQWAEAAMVGCKKSVLQS